MAEKLYAGAVPESVFLKELEAYKVRRKAALDAGKTRSDASFMYGDTKYTIQTQSTSKTGFQLQKSESRVAKEARRRAKMLKQLPTEDIYIKTFGELVGKDLYKKEAKAVKELYKNTDSLIYDIDHINPLAKGGMHARRNLMPLEALVNRQKGATDLPEFKKQMLGLGASSPEEFIKIHGPWPTEVIIKNILDGPDTPEAFNKYWMKKVTGSQKIADTISHTSNLLSGANKARVATIGAASLLPGALGTAASAAEVYERGKIYKESKNWLDGIQLGLANASLFTGWSGVGEIIATPADLLNLGIDAARFGTRKTDTSNRKRFRHGSR